MGESFPVAGESKNDRARSGEKTESAAGQNILTDTRHTHTDFLSSMQARGFTVAISGGSLRVAPASRLTSADREFIRNHKAQLLATLRAESSTTTPAPANAGNQSASRPGCGMSAARSLTRCRRGVEVSGGHGVSCSNHNQIL
jgi:hypothetical protein